MSGQTELSALRHAVTHLDRSMRDLQAACGDSLGIRRLASDLRRLHEDLDEVGPLPARPAPAAPPVRPRDPEPPGEPLDSSVLLSHAMDDLSDEGVGGWRSSEDTTGTGAGKGHRWPHKK